MPSSVLSDGPPPEKRSRATYEGDGHYHNDDSSASDGLHNSSHASGRNHLQSEQRPTMHTLSEDNDNYADYCDSNDDDINSVVTNDDDTDMDDDLVKSLDFRHYRNMDFDNEAGHFVYREGVDIDAQEGIPAVEDYLQKSPRDMKEFRVTFGLSRRILLESFKREYDIFHERCKELNISLNNESMFQYLFGSDSQLVTILKRELKIDLPEVYTFLATFYFSAEFSCAAKRLQDHGSVDYEGYMDHERVNSIWRDIADSGKNGESPTYLWEKIENSLNDVCRNLYLTKPEICRILQASWDDDKAHLHFSTSDARSDPHFLCGLQGFQHQMANCRGFTIDSAISASTGFPLGFRARRQGESDQQCYEIMLRYMFSQFFTVAGAAHLALQGITFCSDRGYWTPALILLILQYGGTVFGTLKRSYWVPFTYNQKRRDKRMQIDTKYGRSIFLAFARWAHYMLKIMAWRGGTGNVSLAMNSDCCDDEVVRMEFKLKRNDRWYFDKELSLDERKLKAFHPIGGVEVSDKDKKNICYHIQHTMPAKMLTTRDLCYIWFTLRTFALTSSSAVLSIRNVAPYISHTESGRPAFVNVLSYAGFADLLGSLVRTRSSSATSDEDDDEDESEVTIDSALVRKVVKLMRRPTQRTANSCAIIATKIKTALRNNHLKDDKTLQAMVVELGVDPDRAPKMPRDKMKALIRSWVISVESTRSIPNERDTSDEESQFSDNSSSSSDVITYKFPYDKLLAAEITAILLSRAGSALRKGELPGNLQHPTTKDERVLVLQTIDNHPTFETNTNTSEEDHNPVRDSILKGIIQRSFLKSLDGKEKASNKLGHQNEDSYLKQYENDGKRGIVPNVIPLCIQRCGLAMHADKPYARGSADGILFELNNDIDDSDDENNSIDYSAIDPIKSHPVECKCRSGSGRDGSLNRAKLIRTFIARRIGQDADMAIARGDAIYMEISSSNHDLLKRVIPASSERIQILHHAYIYGNKKASFLVGDPHGRILFGLVVNFEPNLLRDYGMVLDYIYNNGLNIFYKETLDDLPMELIENILMSDSNLKKKYTIDDFMTQLLLCRACLPNSPSNVLHPIPECSLSVPLDYAMWNSRKGGSDTATQLISKCLPVLPVKEPQTVITARYFMLHGVLFHRSSQSFSGTKDINIHKDTIESVRNRNNKRQPFHASIGWLHNRCRQAAADERRKLVTPSSSSVPLVSVTTFTNVPAPRFNRRLPDPTRLEKAHGIIGSAKVTGLTPLGKGKSKASIVTHRNYEDFIARNQNCMGCIVRLYDDSNVSKNKKSGFSTKGLQCDLCGSRMVSTFCIGCKRVLCFDADRSKQIDALLSGKNSDKLKREYPVLEQLSRGDVPAFYCQLGEVNGMTITAGRSCFHLAHPHLFSPHSHTSDDVEMEDAENTREDDHIMRIANASYSNVSPARRGGPRSSV